MTEAEKGIVTRRRDELDAGLQPFAPEEAERVEIALSAMFAGFRSMRQTGDSGEAIVEVTRAVLREFPAWAIERGCLKIARNEAGLDPTWPPNDAQVHSIVEDIVRPYRSALATASGLLAAKVEYSPTEPPKQRYADFKEEMAARGLSIGPKPAHPEDAGLFLNKYGVSREQYDAIPDLPKDHEYWAGKRG